MAKKKASGKTSKTAQASQGSRKKGKKKLKMKVLTKMLDQLHDELVEIEAASGPSPKTTTALLRINDLLPLVRSCQESMTRP